MKQRKWKLYDAFMIQLEYCMEKRLDWTFYDRPFLGVQVEKPEESQEELDKRVKYLALELEKVIKL